MTTMLDEAALTQRRNALLRANEVRTYRKQAKERLAAAETTLTHLLALHDSRLDDARVYDLVLAMPGVGKTKITKWLRTCGISNTTTVGALTTRQRTNLIAEDGAHRARSQTWRRKAARARAAR